MADHPNAAKYREVTKAFNGGDMAAMAVYVAMTSSGGTSAAPSRCEASKR